ncbi:hypothetical protein CHH28_17155 [Bacterioplanes sanyensis]|uniref:Transglycosylase SLT domain-containing protein n=1 Tax=Bacterioplanes sanyensis TaxID=1249553 RepID=A0A222FMP4_9GAMM|nr:hypothetical protein [Bacterioplanes sanyensis]ASP40298.1 hypothetical protein CHH28_17155 [Bacterioplanes sanyensis]
MGICANELRRWVIEPTLKTMGCWSGSMEQLLLATAAQESGLGQHIHGAQQRGLGIYQISSRTHRNVWDKYLVHHPELASTVRGLASQHDFLRHPHAELTTNLSYATAIAALIYQRNHRFHLEEQPSATELARAWKRFYHRSSDISIDAFANNYLALLGSGQHAA